jgi:hypothetical protein
MGGALLGYQLTGGHPLGGLIGGLFGGMLTNNVGKDRR